MRASARSARSERECAKEERLPSPAVLECTSYRVQVVSSGQLTMPSMASAVKSSATMEPATSMKSTTKFAAGKPSACKAFVREPSAAQAIAAKIAVEPALKSAPFIVTRAPIAAPVKPVEPRAGADKHATNEPVRAVVAVRRAGVRVVAIIAVRTNRCRTVVGRSVIIAWAHSYAHKHSLRVRKGCED